MHVAHMPVAHMPVAHMSKIKGSEPGNKLNIPKPLNDLKQRPRSNAKSEQKIQDIEIDEKDYMILTYLLRLSIVDFDTFESYQSYNLTPPDNFIESITKPYKVELSHSKRNEPDTDTPSDEVPETTTEEIKIIPANVNTDFIEFVKQNVQKSDEFDFSFLQETKVDGVQRGGVPNVIKLIQNFAKYLYNQCRPNNRVYIDADEYDEEPIDYTKKPIGYTNNILDAPPTIAPESYQKIEIKPNILTTDTRIPIFYSKNDYVDMEGKQNRLDNLIKSSPQYVFTIVYTNPIHPTIIDTINNSFPKPQKLTPEESQSKKEFLSSGKPEQVFDDVDYSSLRPVTAPIIKNDYNINCERLEQRIYLFYKTDDDYFFQELSDVESEINPKGGRQTRFKKYTKRNRNIRKRKTRKYKQSRGKK